MADTSPHAEPTPVGDLRERVRAVLARQWVEPMSTDSLTDAVLAVIDPDGLRAEVERLRATAQRNDDLATVWREDHRRTATERDAAVREAAALRAALDAGEASDGHHTHNELYDYRMLYNAHAAQGWLAAGIPVVKSRRHSDGEPCFGGGWFIVTATLPTGQVSNHYRDEHWDLFVVPVVDLPPEYDGHTPADAADRLRALLADPTETDGAGS